MGSQLGGWGKVDDDSQPVRKKEDKRVPRWCTIRRVTRVGYGKGERDFLSGRRTGNSNEYRNGRTLPPDKGGPETL